MSVTLAVATAAVFSLGANADTTLAVRPGTQLQAANFAGEIRVDTWSKDAVRIRAESEGSERVLIKESDRTILVKAYSQRGVPHTVELRITVPSWMDLNVSGIHTDVRIDGARGTVRVETVHGDIVVEGGRGEISLHAVNQDIHLTDASGRVLSETVNGDLTLQRIASDSVDASTVNGEIFYEGTIRDRGVYRFASHNGDISVALPKTASATVNVSTFSGEFASDFPVSLTESKPGRRFCFVVGRGSARVELESFQGAIHIFRPGARGPVETEKQARAWAKAHDGKVEVKAKAERKTRREYGGDQDEDADEGDGDGDEESPAPPHPENDHDEEE